MTFPLMEVWARHGSGTVSVMSYCVWQCPAKHLQEHSVVQSLEDRRRIYEVQILELGILD